METRSEAESGAGRGQSRGQASLDQRHASNASSEITRVRYATTQDDEKTRALALKRSSTLGIVNKRRTSTLNGGGMAMQHRLVEESFTALRRGTPFLKCGRQGRPHFIYLRLAQIYLGPALVWHSERRNKARYVPIGAIREVIVGKKTSAFRRAMSYASVSAVSDGLCFSILYTVEKSGTSERSLDLVATDTHELNLWVTGLLALVEGITPTTIATPRGKQIRASSTDSVASGGAGGSGSLSGRNDESPAPSSFSNRGFSPLWEGDREGVEEDTLTHETQESNVNIGSLQDTAGSRGEEQKEQRSGSFERQLAISSQQEIIPVPQGDGGASSKSHILGDLLVFGRNIDCGMHGNKPHHHHHGEGSGHEPNVLEGFAGLDVRFAAVGPSVGAIICRGGEMYTWGRGASLGRANAPDSPIPQLLDEFDSERVEQVSAGEKHVAAISSRGRLYLWGSDQGNMGIFGQERDADSSSLSTAPPQTTTDMVNGRRKKSKKRRADIQTLWTPQTIEGPLRFKDVVYVDCGAWSTAVITADGSLYTWGCGKMGILGHGSKTDQYTPRRVEELGGKRVLRVSMSVWHAAAVVLAVDASTDNTNNSNSGDAGFVYTWGGGEKGELGDGAEHRLVPGVVGGALEGVTVTQVGCGNAHTVALSSKGQIWTWGKGDGVGGRLPVSLQLPDAAGASYIACGDTHSVAIGRRTRSLYVWGRGDHGCLGRKGVQSLKAPTQVQGVKGEVLFAACGKDITAVVCQHSTDDWQSELERAKQKEHYSIRSADADAIKEVNKRMRNSEHEVGAGIRQRGASNISPEKERKVSGLGDGRNEAHQSANAMIVAGNDKRTLIQRLYSRFNKRIVRANGNVSSRLGPMSPKTIRTSGTLRNTPSEKEKADRAISALQTKNRALEEQINAKDAMQRELQAEINALKTRLATAAAVAKANNMSLPRNMREGHRPVHSRSKSFSEDGADAEWIEEVHKGVFVTLGKSRRTGKNYIRRLRFAKDAFGVKEAEQWWKMNRGTVLKQFGIEDPPV